MKALLCCLLFLRCAAGANTGSNVINVVINSNVTVSPGTPLVIATGPLQNIGQTSHEIRVVGTNLTVGSGQFWGVTGTVQGSLNGTTWFDIGPYSNEFVLTATGSVRIVGINPYPYIRANITVTTSGSTVHISTVYVGNSAPTINQPVSTGPIPWRQDNFQYGALLGSIFSAAETKLVSACYVSGVSPAVYGLLISNVGAADTQIELYAVGETDSVSYLMGAFWLPQKTNLLLPNAERAVLVSGSATFPTQRVDLKVKSTAGTTLQLMTNFRCE